MRRKIIPYNHALKEKARQLRNNSTWSEILLWNYLKDKQMRGFDFHRQKPIDEYIEIDGESHYGNEEKDLKRQKEIEKYGIKFLRFDDLEIRYDLDNVLKRI